MIRLRLQFIKGEAQARTTEKRAQPDRPDLAVLPPAPTLGQVWSIGLAQASIIFGPRCWGGRHLDHPSPIIVGLPWVTDRQRTYAPVNKDQVSTYLR